MCRYFFFLDSIGMPRIYNWYFNRSPRIHFRKLITTEKVLFVSSCLQAIVWLSRTYNEMKLMRQWIYLFCLITHSSNDLRMTRFRNKRDTLNLIPKLVTKTRLTIYGVYFRIPCVSKWIAFSLSCWFRKIGVGDLLSGYFQSRSRAFRSQHRIQSSMMLYLF